MSEFKISQLFDVGERGETGLSLVDTIAVVFGVSEEEAAKLSLNKELRQAHAEGRTRGVAQVMRGLQEAARKGSASAAATLLKASALNLEREAKIEYEVEVQHRKEKVPLDVSASVNAGFAEIKKFLSEPTEWRECYLGPNGQEICGPWMTKP